MRADRARWRVLGRQPQHHAQGIGLVVQIAVVFILHHQLVAQCAHAHPVQAGGAQHAGQIVQPVLRCGHHVAGSRGSAGLHQWS